MTFSAYTCCVLRGLHSLLHKPNQSASACKRPQAACATGFPQCSRKPLCPSAAHASPCQLQLAAAPAPSAVRLATFLGKASSSSEPLKAQPAVTPLPKAPARKPRPAAGDPASPGGNREREWINQSLGYNGSGKTNGRCKRFYDGELHPPTTQGSF